MKVAKGRPPIDNTRAYLECHTCGISVQSNDRHDFIGCECDARAPIADNTWIAIDGGRDYCKVSWGEKADYQFNTADAPK